MTVHKRPAGLVARRKLHAVLDSCALERRLFALERTNRTSSHSVVGTANVTVSLTTYGARASCVHLAIESIANGTVKPGQFVLWLDDAALFSDPPESLVRLQRRGLDIRLTTNFGPHTKYYPSLAEETRELLVTADDDIIYPKTWLADLLRGAHHSPKDIVCHRAHVVKLEAGRISPYRNWPECWSTEARLEHFATGVSGVAYPRLFRDRLREEGDGFLSVAPGADDVWLHSVAARYGVTTRQIRPYPREFPSIPGTQAGGLHHANVLQGQNDAQIHAAYSTEAIARLGG